METKNKPTPRASHTPGPWFSEGRNVFTRQGAWFIAEIPKPGSKSFVKNGVEAEANARLIAAAPEMLEALKYASSALENLGIHDSTLRRQIEAAIAQAEGPSEHTKG